jgi:hypothetical protein
VSRKKGQTVAFAHVVNPGRSALRLKAGWTVAWLEPLHHPEIMAILASGEEELRQRSTREVLTTSDGTLSDHEFKALLEKADADLSGDEREKLRQFLREQEGVFKAALAPPGAALAIPHEIDTQGHTPIKRQRYQLSVKESEVTRQETGKLWTGGVVRRSQSPWSFPVVLIPKKDGTLCFCVDYRDLNAITKKDAYPLPLIDDLLDSVQGSRYRSSMDLMTGYWQVPVKESDREKTAFATPDGLFEFNVLPMGLSNAPGTFQRNMEQLLQGLVWTCCLVYIDDIIVFSRTFDDHLRDLAHVFDRLRQGNMYLKPAKCAFFRKELPFLGHLLTNDGLKPNPAKVAAVRDV